MSLKVLNTLTGRKESFDPINPPAVRMYDCGPTVYDNPHIGHFRCAFVFNIIKNYLTYKGFKVKHLRNITDVDDKIIEKARQEGGDLNEATRKIAEYYTEKYQKALEKLGIQGPDEQPKATETIGQMIQMIEHLITKEIAYASEGNVYFSVKKFAGYGKLSKQSPEQLLKGHRVEPGLGKNDPLDFAIWKNAKEGEPRWQSPWGWGRPGWHIECSVMSQEINPNTGKRRTLDIHGGGVDLVFPHHENEIAQSEAAWDCSLAKYWLHNGLVTVEGEKMSKSVGNVVGVEDILEKGHHPDDLKLFFLQSHYRSPVDFSWERMAESERNLQEFERFFRECGKVRCEGMQEQRTEIVSKIVQQTRDEFEQAMDDDFNTPRALAVLFRLLEVGSSAFFSQKLREATKKMFSLSGGRDAVSSAEALVIEQEIKKLGKVFGLFQGELKDLSTDIATLVRKREELRKAKKFKEADQIRKQLEQENILLEDTPSGTTWKKRHKEEG